MGTVVNVLLIIVGSCIGLLLRKGLPEKFHVSIMNGIGLIVIGIGIHGALLSKNIIVMIVCMTIGCIIGEWLDIEQQVSKLSLWLQNLLHTRFPQQNSKFSEGFLAAIMFMGVGSMAVMGSLQDGLTGDMTILFTKAIIDCITSILLATSYGIGVLFSAFIIGLYQGSLTLLASVLSPFLTPEVVTELSAIGSLLLIALGLNVLKLTQIKIMNFIPSIFLPILLYPFLQLLF